MMLSSNPCPCCSLIEPGVAYRSGKNGGVAVPHHRISTPLRSLDNRVLIQRASLRAFAGQENATRPFPTLTECKAEIARSVI
jgi:hypothetical protein